ncbi:MAG: hypothetical protein M0D57_14425 [Sphingobacteriales bacterium JAD_PAG50586_3]|nr:MAG: hypothetical protein M0D57_14425 [Sphingobacteriales bacterium JAD_PAG50586_3]
MKNLLLAFALLMCFVAQAQNSFKLKKGAELTYQVDENGMVYDLTVTIIDLKPFRISYKNTDGTLKGFTSLGNNSKEEYFKYDYFLP